MIFTPHDYQYAAQLDYLQWVEGDSDSHPYRLYTSPTGTGKSVIELMCMEVDSNSFLVTTRLEIVAGMLKKMGVEGVDNWSTERLASEALAHRISTPVRFRNLLAKGELSYLGIHRILVDEGHHLLANTYKDVQAYLPRASIACFTATGFRGTPKETDEFLKIFDNQIIQILSLRQAADRGLFAMPTCTIYPLIDDDILTVVNGEIQVQSATRAVQGVLDDVATWAGSFIRRAGENGEVSWDRPTMFSVPSVQSANDLVAILDRYDIPVDMVVQDTSRSERNEIFQRTVNREIALVQIDVVSEGVDLPIRRWIDLRPTMSPVKWLQQLGRITRPVRSPCVCSLGEKPPGCKICNYKGYIEESPPEYYCTNRNLERHGYLLEGLIPPNVIKAAQEAFGSISKRSGVRVIGLEGIGKFQGTELPLRNGLKGLMYAITSMDGHIRKDYVILCHPSSSVPIIASRESSDTGEDGRYKWGRYTRIDSLPDLSGYGSVSTSKLTPKQIAWWGRDAFRFGLDPKATVNRKNFQALPVLKDLGLELKGN